MSGKFQTLWSFDNGYGASVIEWRGGYEVAVLKGDDLCYDTPLTSDVERFSTYATAMSMVAKIRKLPPANTESGIATESETVMSKVPASIIEEKRADQLSLGDEIILSAWDSKPRVRTVVGLQLLNDDVEISTAPGNGETLCSISTMFHVVSIRS